jgi:hypothetical protein
MPLFLRLRHLGCSLDAERGWRNFNIQTERLTPGGVCVTVPPETEISEVVDYLRSAMKSEPHFQAWIADPGPMHDILGQ